MVIDYNKVLVLYSNQGTYSNFLIYILRKSVFLVRYYKHCNEVSTKYRNFRQPQLFDHDFSLTKDSLSAELSAESGGTEVEKQVMDAPIFEVVPGIVCTTRRLPSFSGLAGQVFAVYRLLDLGERYAATDAKREFPLETLDHKRLREDVACAMYGLDQIERRLLQRLVDILVLHDLVNCFK